MCVRDVRASLEAPWGHVGSSWGPLGPPQGLLGPFGGLLGRGAGRHVASLARPGLWRLTSGPPGPSWRRIGRLRPRGGAPAGIWERPDAAGDSTPPHPLSVFYYYYSSRAAGPVDRLAFALVRLFSVFWFASFRVSCCPCADDGDDDEEDEEGARAITAIMLLMVSGTEKRKTNRHM